MIPVLLFFQILIKHFEFFTSREYSLSGNTVSLPTVYPLCVPLFSMSMPKLDLFQLSGYLEHHPEICSCYPYLPDPARIEYSCYLLKTDSVHEFKG